MNRTLTDMQILELARAAQLTNWLRFTERCESWPNSKILKAREQEAHAKLQEIESLINELKNQQ